MVRSFIHDRLSTFVIMDDYWKTSNFEDIWDILRARSPFLQSLKTRSPGYRGRKRKFEKDRKCLGDLVLHLEYLKEFICDWIQLPDNAVHHLISLTSLRILSLRIANLQALSCVCNLDANTSCPLHPPLRFLQELELHCDAIPTGSCMPALRRFNTPALQLLNISSAFKALSAQDTEALFAALGGNFSYPNLKSIRLSTFIPVESMPELSSAPSVMEPQPVVILHASALDSLTFPHLETFDLKSHFFDADDADIERIVRGLPNLREFSVACEGEIHYRRPFRIPRMTLVTIIAFAKHCPLLRRLQIFVDMKGWPLDVGVRNLTHDALERLSLGDSPLADIEGYKTVFRLVDTLFPNLRDFSWNDEHDQASDSRICRCLGSEEFFSDPSL